MRRVLKYVGIAFAVFFLVFLIAAVTIPYVYKDDIMQFATEKLGKQVKADISLSTVDISLLGGFPDISIQFNDVCAKSTDTFNKTEFAGLPIDTALYAEKVFLSFNLMDFLFGNYVVQQVIVHDAIVNVCRDKKGNHNWGFSIESDTTGEDMFVELSKIRFKNTLLRYNDTKLNVSASEWFDKIHFSGKFQGDDFFVDVFAAFTNRKFAYEKKEYFPNSVFKCDVSLLRDSSTYIVNKLQLNTPVGLFLSDGTVSLLPKDEYLLDLNVNVESKVTDLLSVMPHSISDSLAPYKLLANIFLEGKLNGKITEKTKPSFICNVACTKGSMVFEKTKFSIATKGELKAKDLSKLNTYEYVSSATSIRSGSSSAELKNLSVTDFEKLKFSIDGRLTLDIDDVAYLQKIEGYGLSGQFDGTFSGKGTFDDVKNFSHETFKRMPIEADLRCNNFRVSAPDDSPYDFDDVSGHFVFSNGSISADSVKGNLREQPFSLQGKASDFISYLFFDGIDTHCNLNCTIESINLMPFYEHYEKYLSSSESTGYFLGLIRFETNRLDFEPYHLTNAATVIRFTRDGIELSDINAQTMQGKLSDCSVKLIDLPGGKTRCVASGTVGKMSAREIFATFDNFDQTVVTDKQIDGSLSGDFKVDAVLDDEYNPIYSTVDALAQVVIEDGSMTNVETLVEIGKKLKIKEDFSNVSFSTLKNTIRLKDDTLYIPDMHIKSNAFELTFAGKHNIESNIFNYYVTLFLQKTLSLKFRNKNKEIEDFGEIEKNSDSNLKIPLRIFGDPDNYNIDYDFKKSKENIKKGMEDQKKEWKEILNSNKTDEEIQEQEKAREPIKSGFELEY